jgi:hypothetical protein
MIINKYYREAAKHRSEIRENYNMGFYLPSEYYCLLWDTYRWFYSRPGEWEKFKRAERIWHFLCLLPEWVFKIYERVR